MVFHPFKFLLFFSNVLDKWMNDLVEMGLVGMHGNNPWRAWRLREFAGLMGWKKERKEGIIFCNKNGDLCTKRFSQKAVRLSGALAYSSEQASV